ncbi:hypothetical protein SISNIDRAFT_491814 [Sistotremastrum niveocremeum HHB9708]|uniref:Uncharacterized protein n=1 Tax=Sistotremastrum niveocremeum HHB9708 TaxID=1314777 RepID=A0A164MCZ9_9AGAM|nr:hypothetical protein SISNIDRAFT_491814 [Sistotremastrum niveocremeum HHB9708]
MTPLFNYALYTATMTLHSSTPFAHPNRVSHSAHPHFLFPLCSEFRLSPVAPGTLNERVILPISLIVIKTESSTRQPFPAPPATLPATVTWHDHIALYSPSPLTLRQLFPPYNLTLHPDPIPLTSLIANNHLKHIPSLAPADSVVSLQSRPERLAPGPQIFISYRNKLLLPPEISSSQRRNHGLIIHLTSPTKHFNVNTQHVRLNLIDSSRPSPSSRYFPQHCAIPHCSAVLANLADAEAHANEHPRPNCIAFLLKAQTKMTQGVINCHFQHQFPSKTSKQIYNRLAVSLPLHNLQEPYTHSET